MPVLGYGTYYASPTDTEKNVSNAIKCGYRHFDTAKWYCNERQVASAIKKSKIKREKFFITGKVESKGYTETLKEIEESMNNLDIEYYDLLLIHWPSNDILGTYRALEETYLNGRAKAIGLSNFNEDECNYIIENAKVYPQVNQIETHIYFQEDKMNKFLNKKNIQHESWAPFAEGYMGMLKDKTLVEISKKYNKSVAQLILRYLIQKDIIVIPKTTKVKHMKENIDVFDFQISNNDMQRIKALDRKEQYSSFPPSMKKETYY